MRPMPARNADGARSAHGVDLAYGDYGDYGSYGTHGAHGRSSHADKVTGVAVAILLHAAMIFLLLQYAPARTALINAVPLMVSLITPAAPKPDVLPKPLPVKHLPQQPRVAPPQPVLAAVPDAPATVTMPPTLFAPPAPIEPIPAPVAAPSPPSAPSVASVAVTPAPVTPPNFNADYLNNPAPAYPAVSRRQGQQGKVMLRVFVNATGGVDQVEIRASSGHPVLDRTALDAVRRWRFVAARQGDQPVAAWVLVPITFTLEG